MAGGEGGGNPSHLMRNTFDVFHFDTSVINRISQSSGLFLLQ